MQNQEKNIQKKRKSIKFGVKAKLISAILPTVTIMLFLILFSVYNNTSKMLLERSEGILQVTTESAVNKVNTWMEETITMLENQRATMEYFNLSPDQELKYIKDTVNKNEAYPAGIYVATTKGELIHASFVPGSNFDVFEKSWYQDGIESERFIFGSVYFDEDSQNYVVGASGVLKDGNENVRGVAAADIYLNAISDIVKDITIEQTGAIFLVDKRTNTIIGNKNADLIGKTLEEAGKIDNIYKEAKDIINSKEDGLIKVKNSSNQINYIVVTPVPESEWAAVSYVPYKEVMKNLNSLTKNIIIISILGILVLLIMAERFIHFIIKPLKKLNSSITQMTEGDFTITVDVNSHDEIGDMGGNLQQFVRTMQETMSDIGELSKTLSVQSRNSSSVSVELSVSSNEQSEAMNELNVTVSQMASSIAEVAESSSELRGYITQVTQSGLEAEGQMKDGVLSAEKGKHDIRLVCESMDDITNKIIHLESSVADMGNSISEINTMVSLIDEIATETNLLSLNASIEAARAGEAGRGFAVVADEIGKLAATSTNAVGNITKLTQNIDSIVKKTVADTKESVLAIKNSIEIVENTTETFDTIFNRVNSTNTAVIDMVSKVEIMNEIAVGVAGITQEQEVSADRILKSFENLNENAKQVFEGSRKMEKDATHLADSAKMLEEEMEKFKI